MLLLHNPVGFAHLGQMKHVIFSIFLTIAPVAALALPSLGEQSYVTNRLLAAAIGDEIRKTCPDISALLWTVFAEARALEKWALDQGYSKDQIDAFLESKTEKKKLLAQRDAYFERQAVGKGDAAGHCRVGRDEIAKRSLIGHLLKAR